MIIFIYTTNKLNITSCTCAHADRYEGIIDTDNMFDKYIGRCPDNNNVGYYFALRDRLSHPIWRFCYLVTFCYLFYGNKDYNQNDDFSNKL